MFDIFCAFLPIFVELSFAAVGILLISSCPNTAAKAKADIFFLSRAMRKESLLWLLHDLKKELPAALKTLPLIIKLPALKASLLAFSSSLVDSLIQSTHRDLGLRLAFHGSS